MGVVNSNSPNKQSMILSFRIIDFQKSKVKLSFITGFLTAACIGYFCLFRHIVRGM